MKRITALLLALVLVLSLFAGLTFSASAKSYSYNPGRRHELCTELSKQAKAYYTGDYSFDKLIALPGSDSGSSLKSMDSELFKSLHTLMRTNIKLGSYKGLTALWEYTDAQNGKSGVQLIYADATGTGFNREHVWPKSRAGFYQKNGGCDVQHLRPSDVKVNSTRSHYTMGNVRSLLSDYDTYSYGGKKVLYYDSSYDGGVGLVEVNDNIKGDVARIMLYVYVTWEQPNLFENVAKSDLPKMDGDDSQYDGIRVMNNLDTLLNWMEIDPVDTWEMGRNDISEDIQNNRNVFIDYPEFAWKLFDRDLPENYDTPSGYAREHADSGSNFTVTANANNDAYGTVRVSGKTVTAVPAEGYVVSGYTLEPAGAAVVSQNGNIFSLSKLTENVTLTVNFSAKTAATIRFSAPEGVTVSDTISQPLYVGDAITLPTVSGEPKADGISYTFVGWSDKEIEDATDAKSLTILPAGASYTLGAENTTLYAVYTHLVEGVGTDTSKFTLVSEAQSDWSGVYMIGSADYGTAMRGEYPSNSTTKYMVAESVTVENDSISNTDKALLWTIRRQDGGNYTIQNFEGKYLTCAGNKSLALVDSIDSKPSCFWEIDVDLVKSADSNMGSLKYNSSSGSSRFLNYTSSGGTLKPVSLFAGVSGTVHYTTLTGSVQVPCADGHTWDEGKVTREATCTEAGEKTYTCTVCSATKTETIAALGHKFENGTCTVCGAADPNFKPVQFTDVDENSWFAGAVKFAVAHNLFKGTGDGTTFSPNMTTSRAMLVTILYRLEGEPAVTGENTFGDVADGRWFTNAVIWASENGIVNGNGKGEFRPDDAVSKEQMATFLYRYAAFKDADVSKRADLSAYVDGDSVNGWAKEAMQWAVAENLISGNAKQELAPRAAATRAVAATILQRFIESIH